jgi:hypothetical protein
MDFLDNNNIIDIDKLHDLISDGNIIAIYTMKFAKNDPDYNIVHATYKGKIDDMPYKIIDIIHYSKLFECFMQIFREYHEQLALNDNTNDSNKCPIQLQIRLKHDKDSPIFLDHSYILDYNYEINKEFQELYV